MIDYLGFGYALMVAGGGVMGYVQAKSIPSLAAGLVFGSVIGFGAYQVSAHNRTYVSLATSLALGGMMGYRFYGSGKFMPAGFIAAMSFLFFIYYLLIEVLIYKGIIRKSPYENTTDDVVENCSIASGLGMLVRYSMLSLTPSTEKPSRA